MPRFYIPRPRIEDQWLKIEGAEARHIQRALRLGTGDSIVVFDGSGKEYEGKIIRKERTSVVIQITRLFSSGEESLLEITLAQSLLKGEKMDYLIQKATELGVKEIIPFFSARSVPLLDRSKSLEKVGRWERIAIGASKQCGRGRIPKIDHLRDYADMLSLPTRESLRLILSERGGGKLKEILRKSEGKRNVFFIVGPEGGWSQQELEEAKGMGFIPISMGQRILRAETASLCMLSILQYEWGDIG